MTDELSGVLADYRAGLDVELQLLTQLEAVAARQHDTRETLTPDALTALQEERQHLLDQLLALEDGVRPLRETIASRLDEARRTPGFEVVSHRHRLAAAAVARIMAVDAATLTQLESTDAARRTDAHTLETGEATLAAYRRVLQRAPTQAGLLDQRG